MGASLLALAKSVYYFYFCQKMEFRTCFVYFRTSCCKFKI